MPLKRPTHEISAAVEPVPYTAHGHTRFAVDASFTTDEGEPVRLQKRGFATKGEALVWAEREIVLIKSGHKRKERKPRKKAAVAADVTVAQGLGLITDHWLDSGRNRSSTNQLYRSVLRRHVLPRIGSLRWSELSQEHIDDLLRDARKMATPKHMIVLSCALRDAAAVGLPVLPLRVDAPRLRWEDRTDYLSADELTRLCEHAQPLAGACFRFLWNTGLRRGELLALTQGDVDLREDAECITVRHTAAVIGGKHVIGPTKGGRPRIVPLNAAAVAAVRDIRALTGTTSGYLLPGENGNPRPPGWLTSAITRACKQAGLRPVSVHVLRHSFASALAQSGVDPHTLATLLGHSSLTCTARYAHLSPEGLRASTKLLDSPPRRTKKSR